MGFLMSRFSMLLSRIFIILPTVLIALTGHECAHGWVSTKLGDPTPKMEGRLSLNPLRHLDPMGTILMILTGFGWAKPVSVNPMYYKDRKKGMALVALAGPLSNLIMAFLGMLLGMILLRLFHFGNAAYFIGTVTSTFVQMNLSFMIFNLIPIPPLDGAKILGMFLPNRTYYAMLEYERYAIILILILSISGAFDVIIGTGVRAVWQVIWNMASAIVL